ncbi:nucleotide exchange factor GrpE [Candidatus Woesearchaeota archaeon]|nr:nucleotide exchange factor GrpE [Candidatus Woesearchaeota archaeon]
MAEKKKQENKKTAEEKTQEPEKPKDSTKELIETLQRVQADFENYKKRVEKEKKEFTKIACSGIISEILPILDTFELALKNTDDKEEFTKGVEMIYSQLFSTLEKIGLKPIESEGKKFDPYLHEALMQEESDKEEGTVIEEFQKGYLLNGKVIRHSKVKISKKKEAKDDKNH